MLVPEHQRSEFHDGDEPREIEDFLVRVSAIEDSREVEKFGALVDFGPEPLFEAFFGLALDGEFFDQVQVREDANNLWETMGLEHV